MANDLIPYKRPGEDVTALATAAVTGKRCVQISAAKVNKAEGLSTTGEGGAYRAALPSGAGANGGAAKQIFGVAKYDAGSGKLVGVARGGIVPITASAALTAGVGIQVAADGTVVVLPAGIQIGTACNNCANGADAEIALNIG